MIIIFGMSGWQFGGGVLLLFSRSGAGRLLQNDETDAGNVIGAGENEGAGALAEFGHADMGVAAEFESRGDEHTVDFNADRAREFK